jgi:hypothetical protein
MPRPLNLKITFAQNRAAVQTGAVKMPKSPRQDAFIAIRGATPGQWILICARAGLARPLLSKMLGKENPRMDNKRAITVNVGCNHDTHYLTEALQKAGFGNVEYTNQPCW